MSDHNNKMLYDAHMQHLVSKHSLPAVWEGDSFLKALTKKKNNFADLFISHIKRMILYEEKNHPKDEQVFFVVEN